MPKKFSTTLRVRYAETDQMGVVYYANYFVWMEAARTEMLINLGLPYSRVEEKGIILPVLKAFCKYIKPAKYEDEVEIISWISKLSDLKITIEYEIRRKSDSQLLATGYTEHAFINKNTLKPEKLPEEFKKVFLEARV